MKNTNENAKYPVFVAHVKAAGASWRVFSDEEPKGAWINLLVDRFPSAPGQRNRFRLGWNYEEERFAESTDSRDCRERFPALADAVADKCPYAVDLLWWG